MDKDEITTLTILGVCALIIIGIVVSGILVIKEDKYCIWMDVNDKNIVEDNWQDNKTLVKLFDKCCDRGIATKDNTVWCFG